MFDYIGADQRMDVNSALAPDNDNLKYENAAVSVGAPDAAARPADLGGLRTND